MEVLLLINCGIMNLNMIENCRTRSEYFAYMLKKEMSKIEGVNPTITKGYPMIKIRKTFKNIFVNNVQNADHIVFIDEYGFYDKDNTFLKQLKLVSHYSVMSLCKHYKYYGGEDVMFSYIRYLEKDQLIHIKPPLDPEINKPIIKNNLIYILISKPESEFKNYNIDSTIYVLNKINELKQSNIDINFEIALINTSSIDFIETDGNIVNSLSFNTYYEYITELNKATIYFQLIVVDDIYRLYELSMSDTLIITKGINISMMIVDELDIFKFDNEDDFSWNDVFSRINTKNTRKKLIDGNYTWENLAKVMINKMKEFKTEYDNNSDKRKQKESTTSNDFFKSKVGYYLNINDRKKVNRASNKVLH